MRPEPGSPQDWLRFARSDLVVAQGPAREGVLLEALCFHAQQAVEKSLKAVLVANGLSFPRTHNIKVLCDLLPATVVPPPDPGALAQLADYAATARYPGHYEEVTGEEYGSAVGLAEATVAWAEAVLGGPAAR